MISSCDVGSLPSKIGRSTLWTGARAYQSLLPLLQAPGGGDAYMLFEEEVVGAFSDKLRAGIDVPNYPQFRDMNEMFLELIRGIEKTGEGYVALRTPSARPGASPPEISALRRNASRIRDLAGVESVGIKFSVTGPYTLASFFQRRDARLLEDLGRAVADIASNSIFDTRYAEVSLLFLDEPVFGLLDDPLLDYGSNGREALRRAWDGVCRGATARDIETGIHLHNASDGLFWEVEHLDIVESHVGDRLYTMEATRGRLEETDKRLKASVCITDFDRLIAEKLRTGGEGGDLQQRVAETWSGIKGGRVDPHAFLEDPKVLRSRLREVVDRFGPERVPYAGPECGLRSFPTYDCAMECLKRVSAALKPLRGRGA